MPKAYVTQRAQDDMDLVLLGTARTERLRTQLVFDHALYLIGHSPTRGVRYEVRSIVLPAEANWPASTHQVPALGEVWVFDLLNLGSEVSYQFLYRMVGQTPEIGRLLHRTMTIPDQIPDDWLVEMLRNRAS